MKKRSLIHVILFVVGVSFFATLLSVPPALPAEFTLKLGVVTPPGHPHTLGSEHFAKVLKQRSGARLEVKIYPSGQLGTNPELVDGVKQGLIDMTVNTPGVLAEYHPITGLLELPYLFSSFDHMMKVTRQEIGRKIAKTYFEATGLRILGYFGGAERNIITRKKSIWTIDDLKGLKMRTWEWKILIDWWKNLGAIPAVISFPEVYTALQTGVVDGAENEFTTFDVSKWGEVCTYVARTQHNFTVRPLVIGEKQLKKLPEDLQKLMLDTGKEASDYAVKLESTLDHKNKENVKVKYGLRFTEPYKKPFIERSIPIIKDFAREKGFEDIADRIIKLGE